MDTITDTPPSWWRRNWKWAVPVTLIAAIVLLCGGPFALIFGGISRAMQSSEPYQHTLAQAQANPEVIAALGEPIEPGLFVGGNIAVNGPTGDANLSIPLKGPRGRATAYVEARKSAGRWHYRTLVIQVDGTSRRINLLAPDTASDIPDTPEPDPLTL
ncbi:MAG: cytochrome c oxidase assembly factor 1 family protein [Xanthomonadaceae bacterium]|jgi:hypothetical protein|nr:cytochrome c oxidase assembly factor 1 family protein [Xanthomonadaceae bacterium]